MSDMPIASMQEPFKFDYLKSSTARRIPRAVAEQSQWTLQEQIANLQEEMVVEMTTHVLADKTLDESFPVEFVVEVEEWASWWQHTKDVLFPTFSRWLRRPPRKVKGVIRQTKRVRVQEYVTFPEAEVYPLPLGEPVLIRQARSETWKNV